MKQRFDWRVPLAAVLALSSAALYFLHYFTFQDPEHIYKFALGDLAFLPIEVLIVTLVIHGMLTEREKRARLEKLNMVVGVFYSELGKSLLQYFGDLDVEMDYARQSLQLGEDWTKKEFAAAKDKLRQYHYAVEINKVDLDGLRDFLAEKRDFLLRLLENPALLEHECFSDLLMAVFHLGEELQSRGTLDNLPGTDYAHLAGDISRVYAMLVGEWVDYMEHLKEHYPYLYSLAVRSNPFSVEVDAVVA